MAMTGGCGANSAFRMRDLWRAGAVGRLRRRGAMARRRLCRHHRDRPQPPACRLCRNPRNPAADRASKPTPPARRPRGPPPRRDRARALSGDRERLLARLATPRAKPGRHHRLDRPRREGRAGAAEPPPEPQRSAGPDACASAGRHVEHQSAGIRESDAHAAAAARPATSQDRVRPRPRRRHARSKRCARAGPSRSAAMARCSKGSVPSFRRATAPRPGSAELRLIAGPHPQRGDGGAALRRP